MHMLGNQHPSPGRNICVSRILHGPICRTIIRNICLEVAQRVDVDPIRMDSGPLSDTYIEPEGQLKAVATNTVMNILSTARACRHDILHAVNDLARTGSCWSVAAERTLNILSG